MSDNILPAGQATKNSAVSQQQSPRQSLLFFGTEQRSAFYIGSMIFREKADNKIICLKPKGFSSIFTCNGDLDPFSVFGTWYSHRLKTVFAKRRIRKKSACRKLFVGRIFQDLHFKERLTFVLLYILIRQIIILCQML